MGCGASSSIKVHETLDVPDAQRNSKSRKKNLKQLHGHLLNVHESTRKLASDFHQFANQRRQPPLDWQLFLNDESENPNEHRLRKAVQACSGFAEEQAAIDTSHLQAYNKQGEAVGELLALLQEHDKHVEHHAQLTRSLASAREDLARAESQHEKAKAKPNYATEKAGIEERIQAKRVLISTLEKQTKAALTTMEASAEQTAEQKRTLASSALLRRHTDLVDYYRRCSELLQQYTEQMHILCDSSEEIYNRASVRASAAAHSIVSQAATVGRTDTGLGVGADTGADTGTDMKADTAKPPGVPETGMLPLVAVNTQPQAVPTSRLALEAPLASSSSSSAFKPVAGEQALVPRASREYEPPRLALESSTAANVGDGVGRELAVVATGADKVDAADSSSLVKKPIETSALPIREPLPPIRSPGDIVLQKPHAKEVAEID